MPELSIVGDKLKGIDAGEEIVISGFTGRFPESDNLKIFQENLFNKKNLITKDHRRWDLDHTELPPYGGKISNLEKFDADFFGVNFKDAHSMDPMSRMVLEHSYEAIVDAGVNPKHLKGSNTGVFFATCYVESEKALIYENPKINAKGILGCSKAMLANRISHWLGVTGPSYNVDTACSSSFFAMEHAYRAIRDGRCDAAIVGGANLSLHPYVTLSFHRLGVLSADGHCKSFSDEANGYVRSETVSVAFLQKAKNAKRIYATIVHGKTNCDGFKEQGITFPSSIMQGVLLKEFYEECKIAPSALNYLEAHGTGTAVGDPEELNAIDSVFCAGRVKPLRIGSIKSNLGHAEPASGMCSIAKVLIANETGIIAPNLHYTGPRKGVKCLEEGRVQVITEPTPWEGGYAGVNSFGFGGANAHILLKSNPIEKVNGGAPNDDLPRLVVVSGRTEEAVEVLLNDVSTHIVETRPLDAEYVRLLHDIHADSISEHLYRGYTIVRRRLTTANRIRDIKQHRGLERPIWYILFGMGSQWPSMGTAFLRFPIFAQAIRKCDAVLKPRGVDIYDILTNPNESTFENDVNSFVGIAAVQIGLVDLLTSLGIVPKRIIGHSVGELACAYANGYYTIEQTILTAHAYHRSARNNHLLDEALIREAIVRIPNNAVTIEIGPQPQLQDVLKKTAKPGVINIALTNRESKDNVEVFLQAIGKLYNLGFQPQVHKLYPEVKFPVSRSTPMISPLIKWDHSEDWYVMSYKRGSRMKSGKRIVHVNKDDEDYEFMTGHVIDGRNLLPATGYLALIWESLGLMVGKLYTDVSVVFDDVKFLRATTIPKEGHIELALMIQQGTGKFEVVEGEVAVVTGFIHIVTEPSMIMMNPTPPENNEEEEMTAKDVYKELKLRGYQYSGYFRGIKSASTNGTRGKIAWFNNWVAFMDNMLQMQILEMDSRGLFVPTGIQKLVINTKAHYNQFRALSGDVKEFPVYRYKSLDLIVSGGVEIRGLKASVISRRKPAGEPVLESYQFIAHRDCAEISLNEATRLAAHLVLENHQEIKVKTLESLDADEKYSVEDLFTPILQEALGDIPLIQPELNILTENSFEEGKLPVNINITENKKLTPETNSTILSGRYLLTKKHESLPQLLTAVKNEGFLLTLEPRGNNTDLFEVAKKYNLDIIFEKVVDDSLCLLLRKQSKSSHKMVIVNVKNDSFEWLNELKSVFKGEKEQNNNRIVLVSEKHFESGLLGLVTCLRQEPGGEMIRGVLIQDEQAPEFSPSLPLYADQLKLNLTLNVLRANNTWGSYRHLKLSAVTPQPVYHAWVNQLVRGDMSSLAWLEGPIRPNFIHPDLIDVVYSALNFRDVMLTSGKLVAEIIAKTRFLVECCIGFEYSGVDRYGKRLMGLMGARAITNKAVVDRNLSWYVPEGWSLEDAATVPCVYATAYYAMIFNGKIKKSDKVLIHSGTGGVGQAAIILALHEGCEVFTTVGTPEKLQFIRDHFPQIPEDHIGNSRDTSFETMILEKTNGRGVDIVLNSLADDKLQASIRCLAEGGRFLEIGKFDMANDTHIGMAAFRKGISFFGILLDNVFEATSDRKQMLNGLLQKGLDEGYIKPLPRTVFSSDKLEAAFRYMGAGKHIGKVLIKVLDEKNLLNTIVPALPRYYCLENCSYVILGGLGGFGLELADWLVLRGARNLVLTSRSGLKNGYQRMRVRLWKSYGVKVEIVAGKNPANHQECEDILKLAENLAPVDGIFNLAVVLKDSLIENQTPDTFKESFTAKAWTTKVLDKVSRIVCPKLRHFVVFSSVSCGRGNAGQSNYGMSNSIVERICEKRVAEGLPALAVQWGAVGDVGLVADMQQDNKELKRAGTNGPLNVVETVLNIMGLKDLKSVSQHTSLAELGMDSMMAVEIKQSLEREFEIFLTAQDIRGLNFAKLIEMSSKSNDLESTPKSEPTPRDTEILTGMKLLIRLLGKDVELSETCVKLPTKEEAGRNQVFLIPGIEGFGSVFYNLANKIKSPATCLQLNNSSTDYISIFDMAKQLLPHVLKRNNGRRTFVIAAYSFGSTVAIELARLIEAEGFIVRLVLIDGAPELLKAIKDQQLSASSDEELATNVLVGIMDLFASSISEENYETSNLAPLRSPIILLKPSMPTLKSISEDYGLGSITRENVEVRVVEAYSYDLSAKHNHLLDAALIREAIVRIPKNAVTIEIAPQPQLQDVLKKTAKPEVINIALTNRESKDNVEVFLQAIGKLYNLGFQPQVHKLYPEVKFPVSRSTPMISPLIKWDHSKDWYVMLYKLQTKLKSGERIVQVNKINEDYEFMTGHVIDGRNLIPATGYLALIWETIGRMMGKLYTDVSVVFEDVKFLRATTIPKEGHVELALMIQQGTGRFEVVDGEAAVVTGFVHIVTEPSMIMMNPTPPENDEEEEMTAKDVYKELRLRGYQYSGYFRGIKSATTSGTRGKIAWYNNWVAFMDTMLQIQILEMDSRGLFVPTGIQKLVINTKAHYNQFRALSGDVKEFPVYRYKSLDLIVSGGVEIRGLKASVISRRKPAGEPVLESYQFIAHRDRAEISLNEATRLAAHLVLENNLGIKVKTLESLDADEKYSVEDLFTPMFQEALDDIPLIQPELNILTENSFEEGKLPANINITEIKKLTPETNATILSGRYLLTKKHESLPQLLTAVKNEGFLLTLEPRGNNTDLFEVTKKYNLDIIFEKVVDDSLCLLLRKQSKSSHKMVIVNVKNDSFEWLNELKSVFKGEKEQNNNRIVLVSEKSFESGLLGLVTCLRQEPGGEMIRGVLIQDEQAPEFSPSLPLYADQLKLNLTLNVLRANNTWGSYRHLKLSAVTPQLVYHAWANQLVRGDMSSLAWLEGPIRPNFIHPDLIDVVYSAINFRDVMFTSGKLAAELIATNRWLEECCIGFEYSGVDRYGKRIMGLTPSRAITNKAVIDRDLSWYVPKGWSLEDAATVPCVYATAYYAMFTNGKIKKSDKVLIHSGTGGVGQAAIMLALHVGCEVFTTVGTPEKRQFMRDNFPQIPEDHIGNSRDTSFETMILERTNGRGVDIVLNSLAEDKLQASIRCLAEGGRFLEIGKFDMANDTHIGMAAFGKGISFYGILLDNFFKATTDVKKILNGLLQKGLDDGYIKPLPRTVFSSDKLEAAFRYMGAGKHIGKKRVAEGLPALAVQWGAVGDVGLVADMQEDNKELVIGGTLQQKITSCLQELNNFLMQSNPIVSSMVVAEKRAGTNGPLNVVETVLNIMGLKDLKSVSQHTSLAELGMDSMMAVEIKQSLEREFDIFLTAQDIRSLNFAKLIEMSSKDHGKTPINQSPDNTEVLTGLKLYVQLMESKEEHSGVAVKLETQEEAGRTRIFFIPGIEGQAAVFSNLVSKIKSPATCLQLNNTNPDYVSFYDIANQLLPHVLKNNEDHKHFVIIGYSIGSLIAIELVRKLEAKGLTGKLILIDGSPDFTKAFKDQMLPSSSEEELQHSILMGITEMIMPTLGEEYNSWKSKLDTVMKHLPSSVIKLPQEEVRCIITAVYNRFIALQNYDSSKLPALRSSIVLLKPSMPSIKFTEEDYGLSKIACQKVKIHVVEGNHLTMLNDNKIATILNDETTEIL
ncbi:GSCOCG00002249001-RA-CDS, partial [Cotesia congregata]